MIPCPLAIILYQPAWLYAWNYAGGGPWLYRVVFAQRRVYAMYEQQWLVMWAITMYDYLINPAPYIITISGTPTKE